MDNRQRLTALLLWSAVLTIAWFAYAPALGAAFLLDDVPNLAGLASVHDGMSAINFVFSGISGPLGRPLALSTFLPQAAAWGNSAVPFLRVNILIHLVNACLLAWVLYRLSVARAARASDGLFVAFAAAAVWLLMPLLASSSLMIIQRMTTLSAFFVLLGLAAYLGARQSIEHRPAKALIGMSTALVLGTLLAVFTKENGALLPTFVLVMEATLLSRPKRLQDARWRIWKSLFLALPTVMILGYLVYRFPYAQEIVLKREFTGWERLLTESRILWEYLVNAFVPQPGKFGPFHDGYPVARTIMDPVTFLAFSGWLVALTLAVLWRRRYPLFAFAVLWFLGGHLLESTVIPLDLYYEHRNYLPIVGPLYALCALAAQVSRRRKRLVYAGAGAYVLVSALVLFSLTSLWGNPSVAYRYWQERFPESTYAATAVMAHIQATEGPRSTIQALRRFVSSNPEAAYLKIHELRLSCMISPQQDHRRAVAELNLVLKHVDFAYTALTMLSQLSDTVNETACNGVDYNTVRGLANALMDNPRYKNDETYNQLHHQLLALTSQYEGNRNQAIWHLKKAIQYQPSTDLNKMMVFTYVSAREFGAARAYIEEARANAPYRPMKRFVWLNKLDNLSQYIDNLE